MEEITINDENEDQLFQSAIADVSECNDSKDNMKTEEEVTETTEVSLLLNGTDSGDTTVGDDNTLPNDVEDNTTYSRVETPVTNNAKELEEEAKDQFFEISVTEASKIGEGMSSYVTYKVETKTNLGFFKKPSCSVQRRFSDFLGLHDKLVEKYLRCGRIIPPAPEKNVFATTKVKMSASNAEQNSSSTEFVEKRRASLERYLKRTATHPILKLDPDFREFLETDGELPKATNTSALSGAGVKRLFNKFGETVNKITYKMEENEPWFEEKTIIIENMDAQLRKMHATVESLVANRREMAYATSAFAKSTAMLSNCEEHTALSRALSQLADVEEKVESLHHDQANKDFSILCELLKDYIALIGAVKDVLHERVKVYQNWQHAQMMLTRKREAKVRHECAARADKIPSATNDVVEWEAKVSRSEDEFQKISRVIKEEYDRFEANRVKEFKQVTISYLEALYNNQTQLAKHWEGFLPEAKAIN